MKFLPRMCGPSLFSRLPDTQFPVSMIHSGKPLHQTNEKVKTCSNHSYAIPSATKDFRKWSFFVNTVKDWNNLPPDIAAAKSLESFKAQVAKLFE